MNKILTTYEQLVSFNHTFDAIEYTFSNFAYYNPFYFTEKQLPEKVFFNSKKKTTTLLYPKYSYGKKEYNATTVKATKGDEFDKKMGFLIAYFQKHSGLTKTQANKYLKRVVEDE